MASVLAVIRSLIVATAADTPDDADVKGLIAASTKATRMKHATFYKVFPNMYIRP